jgi:hypothetical protein
VVLVSDSESKRRSYGSGSLYVYRGSWYARWRIGPRQVKKKVGAKRQPGTREGLTKAQAEEELRRLMREVEATPQERLTLRDFLERKPSTIQDYEGILNKAEQGLPKKTTDRYEGADIEGYVRAMKKQGRSRATAS